MRRPSHNSIYILSKIPMIAITIFQQISIKTTFQETDQSISNKENRRVLSYPTHLYLCIHSCKQHSKGK
ncbi:hypothetical protein JHK82_053372 [Glycine max]|uniref:Uncharacterized protein n=1 Tax=Glycine max TaxID=3847 RepID=A0A0R0EKT8_SOYBN|nr:hypothetical protein JHK86_053221 [Glycine max]KAG4915733.1 hypothetical protein JHK87_053290 [Glycine soja]KAG4927675.1 hypothetical protein JHK85_054161 [Glycine max]KAG5083203.1 hypothetical protein JHK84_053241 [Glycine max]KAG5085975.1 hypothetical protein JHK82_053372 [Glycine max]